MAELTATGSPTAEGPVSRQDSAHDMAQGGRSLPPACSTPCGHANGLGRSHAYITCPCSRSGFCALCAAILLRLCAWCWQREACLAHYALWQSCIDRGPLYHCLPCSPYLSNSCHVEATSIGPGLRAALCMRRVQEPGPAAANEQPAGRGP